MQKKTIVLKIEKVKLISELYSWNKKIIVSLSRVVISQRKKGTFVLTNGDKANALGLDKRDLSDPSGIKAVWPSHKSSTVTT